jgi:chaperonin cofactor prefoldin
MTELPNRCICGYQGKIDRLHQSVENLCNEMVVLESERDDLQRQLDRLTNNYKPAFLQEDVL